MKKYVINTPLVFSALLSFNFTSAETYGDLDFLLINANAQLPQNCDWGRSIPNPGSREESTVALEDVQNAYQASEDLSSAGDQTWSENAADAYEIYQFGKALKSLYDSTDYLRIEAPDYVVRGQPTQFKANMNKLLAYASFYNNEDGYVGRDKSNYEANSYFDMTFDHERGAGLAWATRGDLCSATGFWVQNAPEVSIASVTNGETSSTVKIRYYIDNAYSKAIRDGQPAKIQFSQSYDGISRSVGINLSSIRSQNSFAYNVNDYLKNFRVIKGEDNKYYGEFDYVISDMMFQRSYYNPVSIKLSDGVHSVTTSVKTWKPLPSSGSAGTREACGRAGKPYPCTL